MKYLGIIMLVVMVFLTLAACGGDENEKASPTPTPDPRQAPWRAHKISAAATAIGSRLCRRSTT